jgi:hypothetical protein
MSINSLDILKDWFFYLTTGAQVRSWHLDKFCPSSSAFSESFFFTNGSQYNLANKANLVHNLFLVYSFLVHLSLSTCLGWFSAHHQEKQLCLCDTWYLLFCMNGCLVCRLEWKCVFLSSTSDSILRVDDKLKNETINGHRCLKIRDEFVLPNVCQLDSYEEFLFT